MNIERGSIHRVQHEPHQHRTARQCKATRLPLTANNRQLRTVGVVP